MPPDPDNRRWTIDLRVKGDRRGYYEVVFDEVPLQRKERVMSEKLTSEEARCLLANLSVPTYGLRYSSGRRKLARENPVLARALEKLHSIEED